MQTQCNADAMHHCCTRAKEAGIQQPKSLTLVLLTCMSAPAHLAHSGQCQCSCSECSCSKTCRQHCSSACFQKSHVADKFSTADNAIQRMGTPDVVEHDHPILLEGGCLQTNG